MTTPTDEFPLETPCPIPGGMTTIKFLSSPFDAEQKIMVVSQDGIRHGVDVCLTEHNLREIAQIADGRLVNRMMNFSQELAGIAVDDQSSAFIRDHERLLTEYILSDGSLDVKERLLITLIQACVLTTIKLVRAQQ